MQNMPEKETVNSLSFNGPKRKALSSSTKRKHYRNKCLSIMETSTVVFMHLQCHYVHTWLQPMIYIGPRPSNIVTHMTTCMCVKGSGNPCSNIVLGNKFAGNSVWYSITSPGWILAAFFYGYALTQIPGGWLATRFGGKWVFGVGVVMTSVFTLFTPLAALSSVELLIVVRVLEGFFEVKRTLCHTIVLDWIMWCSFWVYSDNVVISLVEVLSIGEQKHSQWMVQPYCHSLLH